MSTTLLFETISLPTITDLSLKQYHAVSMDATGAAVLAVAGKACSGVLQNNPDGTHDTSAALGTRGKTRVVLGGTVAIADPLEIATGGVFIVHGTGTVVAFANEPGDVGGVITATLTPSNGTLV